MFDNIIRAFKQVLLTKAFGALKRKLILRRQKDLAKRVYPYNLQKKCLESIVGFCAARKSLAERKTQVEKVANKNKLSVAMSQW